MRGIKTMKVIDGILLSTSESALNGRCTWQAICDSAYIAGERLLILYTFRGIFRSDVRWPDNDFETRCLSFLLLKEFLNNP